MPHLDNNRIRTALPLQIGELCLCDFGYDKVVPSHSFGPAVRDYTLLHFVLEGEGTFYEGGNTHTVKAGECFRILPDTVTTYTADSVHPWEYLWIGMRGRESDDVIAKAFGCRAVAPFCKTQIDIGKFLNVDNEPPFAFGLKAISLLYELLSSICLTSAPIKPQQPDIVRDAVRYIENNYFHPFDVSTLARTLGISRAHFSVIFGKAVGVSPYKYLLDYRLKRATELLMRTPPLTVEEIAYSVGFSSIERFSEMFKKRFGVSPRSYRSLTQPTSV